MVIARPRRGLRVDQVLRLAAVGRHRSPYERLTPRYYRVFARLIEMRKCIHSSTPFIEEQSPFSTKTLRTLHGHFYSP